MNQRENETNLIGDILAENDDDEEFLNSLKLTPEDFAKLQNRALSAPPIGVFIQPGVSNEIPNQGDQHQQAAYYDLLYSEPPKPQEESKKVQLNAEACDFVPSSMKVQPGVSNNIGQMPPPIQSVPMMGTGHGMPPGMMPNIQTGIGTSIPQMGNPMINMGQPGMSYPNHYFMQPPQMSPWAHYYGEMGTDLLPRKPPDLNDLKGQIVEASKDQHGSRLIQYRFETASNSEKQVVFEEVLPQVIPLSNDVFGNYVVQKILEFGTSEQKILLVEQLIGQVMALSNQVYGCRVIQKSLEIAQADQKLLLIKEIKGIIMALVQDQNGNHVVQKCVEYLDISELDFIIDAFRGKVHHYSLHPYGCRVLQRMLEHLPPVKLELLMDEVIPYTYELSMDQYGNYVIQHLLEFGFQEQKSRVIDLVPSHIMELSMHKYASNVLEKCLIYGSMEQKQVIITEMTQQSNINMENPLMILMKDRYGNYVVQRALKLSQGKSRQRMLDIIRENQSVLRNFTYGKHIIACVEKLSA